MRNFLVSALAVILLNVCTTARTSTSRSCIHLPITWILALSTPSCRLIYSLWPLAYHTILMCRVYIFNAMYFLTGFDPGGRDVDFCCATNHAITSATAWTVCLQRTCYQSTTRRSLLCQLLASSAQQAQHHHDQERRSCQLPS